MNKPISYISWLITAGVTLTVLAFADESKAQQLNLFPAGSTPAVPSENDPQAVELGVKFKASVAGRILGVKYYRSPKDLGGHTASLWNSTGSKLRGATFRNETSNGWQTVLFSTPYTIAAGKTYVASFHSNGNYAYSSNFFSSLYVNGSLSAPSNAGVYRYGPNGFPNQTYQATNYWVDVIFEPANAVPTVNLAVNPSSINLGQSASLTYSYSNAASCVASGFALSGTSATIAVSPSASTNYSLSCTNAVGTTNRSASLTVVQPSVINGVCGSANGVPVATPPQSSLCLAGSAGAVTGAGPFNWSCMGSGGGTTSTCSAPLSVTPPTPTSLPGPSLAVHSSRPYYTCVNNRYVATAANGGSDSNNGMSATNQGNGVGPWLTLAKANNSLPSSAAGYCVNVGDGTYNMGTLGISRGGSSASMTGFVVYRSTNLLGAKLTAVSNGGGLVQARVPYVIIDGFEMDGRRYSSSNYGIDACYGTAGSFNGTHHLIALNNYIHDFGGSGIGACWGEYYWFIHNRSNNNSFSSWYSGISTYEPMAIPNYVPTDYDKRFTPYHNVYAFNSLNGNMTAPENGPHTDGNGLIYDDSQHHQIAPNIVYPHMALILGNIATRNGGAGINVGPSSANVDVFNNTSYNNQLDLASDGTWRGEFVSSGTYNVNFKNNIGFAVRGAGILSYNNPFLGGAPAGTNTWLNNVAFGNSVYMEGSNTFSSSLNKANTNPLLANPTGGNLALCTAAGVPHASCTGASPALGYGAVVPYWHQQTAGAIDVGACPRDAANCL